MSSNTTGKSQPNLESKMSKMTVDDQVQQPEGSSGGRGRSTSKSGVPVGTTATAKSGIGHRAKNKSPVRKWSPSRPRPGDDATQKDVSESSGGRAGAAARAAKSPPLSWKQSKVDVIEDVLFVAKRELGHGFGGKVSKVSLVGGPKREFAIKQVEIQKVNSKLKLDKKDFVKLAKEIANQRKCAEVSPLVLPVFAWSVEINEGSLWLLSAMPLCKGSLESFIRIDGIRDPYKPYVKLFTLQLCEAVAVLHRLRVMHADVYPQNVFVFKDANNQYRLVLADFGESVDFSDSSQKAVAAEGPGAASEPDLMMRDLYGIASCYLGMQYGGVTKLKATMSMDDRMGRYKKNLAFENMADGPLKDCKRNEKYFVCSLLNSPRAKEPLVQAKQIKLLPFFQGDRGAHPDWANDLRELDDDHRSDYVEGISKKVPLIDLLRDGGKLKLRKQVDDDELAQQRTTYSVGGEIYAQRVELCPCLNKVWADIGVRNDRSRHFIARLCFHGGETTWHHPATDALHLAELVDANHERYREPWCALVNFFNDPKKHAIGTNVESALREKNIVWTEIDADALHEEIGTAQSKEKPASSNH